MLNRDIYQKDPSTRKLVNEGVASVNDEKTNQALSVLRYELETFVCDGQYEKGLEHILDVYLKNIEQAEQPAGVHEHDVLRVAETPVARRTSCSCSMPWNALPV